MKTNETTAQLPSESASFESLSIASFSEKSGDLPFSKRKMPSSSQCFSLNKRQVLSSKIICTKCKSKLLAQDSRFFTIFPNIFKRYDFGFQIQPFEKRGDCRRMIFANNISRTDLKNLGNLAKPRIKWNKAELCKKLFYFKNLNYVLIKLFIGKEITDNNLKSMTALEQEILKMVITKKQFKKSGEFRLTGEYFNQLTQSSVSKRFEENLRFITNKTFRFLQTIFKQKVLPTLNTSLVDSLKFKSESARQAYAFFGYYFEQCADEAENPIESFFHPNTHRIHDLSNKVHIPKTVSQQYIKTIRRGPTFIRDFMFYLDKIIRHDAEFDIVKKTRKLCQNWEAILREKGSKEVVEVMREQFNVNPKFKLPWTSNEVVMAVDQMKKILQGS